MVDKGGGSVSFDLDGMKGNAWDGCCQGYRWVRVLGHLAKGFQGVCVWARNNPGTQGGVCWYG